MTSAHFLTDLALVLCVAAVTTVVFQWLRQPVVLGYVLAGLIVGPNVPVPLAVSAETMHTLSELGVVLLMFSIGLEFSLRKLAKVGPSAGLTVVVQVSFMVSVGYLAARLLGWTALEAIFTGAVVAISSTMIVAKALPSAGVSRRISDVVFGVLIFQDLAAVLLLAVLTALAAGSGVSAAALLGTVGRLLFFLLCFVVIGLLVLPRSIRAIVRLQSNETLLVASVGISFAAALLAQRAGYSVALGAFVAGSLVAESGEGTRVEHLIQPLRDMFAAIFFVSVGMMIEPALILRNWAPVLVLSAVVVVGQVLSVTLGSFLTGQGVRTSIQAGMSLAQIGEFSFVIAGVGRSMGATGEALYPVAVAVSGVTTLLTPFLIRASGPAASLVDKHLPRRLQTFAALYGSWVDGLKGRSAVPGESTQSTLQPLPLRRRVALIVLDAACLAGVLIGTSLGLRRLTGFLVAQGLRGDLARGAVLVAAGVLCLVFGVGLVRSTGRLSRGLARRVLPPPRAGVADLGAAPRRALTFTWHLSMVMLVAVLLLALTQPFLPRLTGLAVLLGGAGLMGAVVFFGARDLQGHVNAGAQIIVEALASQSAPLVEEPRPAALPALDEVRRLLPGLGALTTVLVPEGALVAGRTLAAIDLRGLTGATALAVRRDGQAIAAPGASQVLRAGDVVVLSGTSEAVALAEGLLLEESGRKP